MIGENNNNDSHDNKVDARVHSIIGTIINFIGLMIAIILWIEKQTVLPVAIGLILIAIGCMIFTIGQFIGINKKVAFLIFWLINIWILCIIPISCIFNVIQGIVAGHSHYIRHCWTITPIPRHENSICWIIYFLICVIGDIIILKCSRR